MSTLLTYELRTTPTPLVVSPLNQSPSLAALELVITNPSVGPSPDGDVLVNSITITFNVGTGVASALMQNTTNVTATPSDDVNWNVNPPSSTSFGSVTYTLEPKIVVSPNGTVTLPAGEALIVTFWPIPTSTLPGTAVISIEETTPNNVGFLDLSATTYPVGVYFDSLAASTVQSPGLTPVAQVTNGAAVTLTWNGSDPAVENYTVYQSSAEGQLMHTPTLLGTWTSSSSPNGLTCDTVFTVEMTTIDPLSGAPFIASQSVAVSVQNPDLVANSLTIPNTGSVVVGGALNVYGGTTLSTNGPNLNALTVLGPVSLFGQAVSLAVPDAENPVTYLVTTDGLLIGMVSPSGGIPSFPDNCGSITANAYAADGTALMTLVAYGGWSDTLGGASSGLLYLPVQNGCTFDITCATFGIYKAPTYTFYFMPIGSGTATIVSPSSNQ